MDSVQGMQRLKAGHLTLVYPKGRCLSPAQRAFLRFLESQRPLAQGHSIVPPTSVE